MDNIVKFLIQHGKIDLGYNVIYTVLNKVHNVCRYNHIHECGEKCVC